MGMLEQNSANPFRNRKKKHIVAERGRPIGHGEADAFARDHSPTANEKQRRNARNPRERVEPATVAAVCDRRIISGPCAHSLQPWVGRT